MAFRRFPLLRAFLKQVSAVVFVHRLVLGTPSYVRFLLDSAIPLTFSQRLAMVRRINRISRKVTCAHDEVEAMAMVRSILTVPPAVKGVIVEAGCFKGGSTAKLSLAARATGRTLVVFDSFAGIPPNDESHGPSGHSGPLAFEEGTYAGALDEVKGNVSREGEIGSCEFVKGWFDDTLPAFTRPVVMMFMDVDLASSTRTCLKHLYPRLQRGCHLYSHDAEIARVQEVFADEQFWRDDVGAHRPAVDLRLTPAMMRISKP
jgi:O-methyltransferase